MKELEMDKDRYDENPSLMEEISQFALNAERRSLVARFEKAKEILKSGGCEY